MAHGDRDPSFRTQGLEHALDAWHAANRSADEAQRRLRLAWEAYLAQGGAVPQELVTELHRTRRIADARLREAVTLAERLR